VPARSARLHRALKTSTWMLRGLKQSPGPLEKRGMQCVGLIEDPTTSKRTQWLSWRVARFLSAMKIAFSQLLSCSGPSESTAPRPEILPGFCRDQLLTWKGALPIDSWLAQMPRQVRLTREPLHQRPASRQTLVHHPTMNEQLPSYQKEIRS